MTERHLFFDEGWVKAFRALASEDLVAARRVMVAVNALAREPEPADSYHWGDSSLYRLHVGDYRVLYEVIDDTVRIWSLGHAPH